MFDNVLVVFVIFNRTIIQLWLQIMIGNVLINSGASRHLPCRVLSSRHFLTVFPLMTAALFCYFFTFLLKKGVQKRVPQNRLIIRKTHFMGGTLKNRGHILWFFTRDSWVCQGVRCPSQKSLFFRRTEDGERTDIGSEKLADVIGASRNQHYSLRSEGC